MNWDDESEAIWPDTLNCLRLNVANRLSSGKSLCHSAYQREENEIIFIGMTTVKIYLTL